MLLKVYLPYWIEIWTNYWGFHLHTCMYEIKRMEGLKWSFSHV